MKKIIAALTVSLLPATAFAQSLSSINNVNDVTNKFQSLLDLATSIIVALAVVFIIWNVVKYLIQGGADADKRKEAQSAIFAGIIGLFVIVSIWGLVSILKNTFVTTDTTSQSVRNINRVPIPVIN